MKDAELRERLDAVKHIIQQFEEDGLEERDGEELLQEGLEQLEAAKELLDLGSGKVVVVEKQENEIVEEPLTFGQ